MVTVTAWYTLKKAKKKEILCWEANIKCFKVPLFRKYFSLSSSLLDKIVSRFIFNEFIITSVQSTCKRPYNSNSRVHRRLKKVNGRKQNSKNVHAKKKKKKRDNCFRAISLLNLVISTIIIISINRFQQCG